MNESTLVPREEMSDLDWLARNVHVWPAGHQGWCYVISNRDGTKGVASSLIGQFDCPWVRIEKQEWLARRAELQNKPSWKCAPEWATHLAQASVGNWFFFSGEPYPRETAWHILESIQAISLNWKGEVIGDWRDTLEKRPEQAEFKPFVSVEDAKISILQSDGDVKHFGGIIGRNLIPEEDAATAKQPAPKGSGNPILGMVLADLTNRALEGKEKYGEPLLAHNGRNPLWDAYQEALDLAMYLRQAIEEQK